MLLTRHADVRRVGFLCLQMTENFLLTYLVKTTLLDLYVYLCLLHSGLWVCCQQDGQGVPLVAPGGAARLGPASAGWAPGASVAGRQAAGPLPPVLLQPHLLLPQVNATDSTTHRPSDLVLTHDYLDKHS